MHVCVHTHTRGYGKLLLGTRKLNNSQSPSLHEDLQSLSLTSVEALEGLGLTQLYITKEPTRLSMNGCCFEEW